MDTLPTDAISHFCVEGELQSLSPFGGGHINDTYLAVYGLADGSEKRYILQRVNQHVFRNVALLMENIENITSFLSEKLKKMGRDPNRETLQMIRTESGDSYYRMPDNECWRVFHYIEGSVSMEKARTTEDFKAAGAAFGRFQWLLSDYPAESLNESIPHFHDTPQRVKRFWTILAEDIMSRASDIKDEVAFISERASQADYLIGLLGEGKIPVRVTHNDTKLNNILFDATSEEALCVVDLDTVMPGLCHYDFGDAIRFGASTTAEDEADLQKVEIDLALFEAFAQGFLCETRGTLNEIERQTLLWGAKLITFECGIRFLTDFLEGDIYFKTHRSGQNLDRARNQFKLVMSMEENWEKMQLILDSILEETSASS